MAERPKFRGWPDEQADPDRGFRQGHDDGRAPRRGDASDRAGAATQDDVRARRQDADDDRRAAASPETVAWPWAGRLDERTRQRPERPFIDRARDEVASWVGDDAAARRRQRDYTGVGPRNYRRSDTRIEEDVNDDLTADPLLDASHIEVTVRDREVTLDGFVADRQAKRRAEDCADFVAGVVHVQNNLRIRGPSSEGSEAFAPGTSP
ncbi:BON domain-containing protein [Roseivivax isoporae]|uniref:BON domain-containing protein n=1 Tax=Roseivivax isoporae LMG 25204 TaxID=1449351 RepID=X7F816_9RHOB|nr:BON domain-containing protein [Roseivivax isoporae]ETX29022.1 hypothetical protein RISW2_03515 [Roseivivax isoporae LMG 25204]